MQMQSPPALRDPGASTLTATSWVPGAATQQAEARPWGKRVNRTQASAGMARHTTGWDRAG